MKNFFHNIDNLIVQKDFWSITGWLFSEESQVRSAELRFTGRSRTVSQSISCGEYREDVDARYRRGHISRHSGIFGIGAVPFRSIRRIELVATFSDGTLVTLDVTRHSNLLRRVVGRFRQRGLLGIDLIRRGRVAELSYRSARLLTRWVGRAKSQLRQHMPGPVPGSKNAVLVVDHAMGGGANAFSARMIGKLVEAGRSVYVLRFSIGELRCLVEEKGGGGRRSRVSYFPTDAALSWLARSRFSEVHVNNLVSMPYVPRMLNVLAEKRSKQGSRLQFYFHDYHSICPSFTLVDHTKSFCGVPDTDVCNHACMPHHQQALFRFANADDIDGWRSGWRAFLDHCDEIRFFSEASFEIFTSVHDGIDENRICIAPHDDSYTAPLKAPTLKSHSIPVIGIIGTIDEAKGAQVVQELVDYIESNRIRARVVVFGSIAANIDRDFVHVTGPYRLTNL